MNVSSMRIAVVGAVGAALLTGVVGCATEAAAAPDHSAFEQCLTDHGVPAPPEGGPHGPGGPGGEHPDGPPPGAPAEGQTPPAPPGVEQSTWDSAMQACASLRPEPPAR